MTCKGQFFCRCKKPHAIISSGIRWRQKECGFRQVGPSSELLHLAIIETITVNNHSYGIASIWLAGKDINLREATLHAVNSAMLASVNN
jgi:hypothetical protein